MTRVDPDYFKKLATIQRPRVLWVGCSDSRVPPTDVTGLQPGDIFVHRNVANQVIHSDFNFFSVLQYSVEVLKIPEIIVCGHTNCGGVKHAMSGRHSGLINNWLKSLKDVYQMHSIELNAITDPDEREKRFIEMNVEHQVYNICQSSFIQQAWKENKSDPNDRTKPVVPNIHGWVYDVGTGIVKDLQVNLANVHPIYKLEL